MVGVLKVMKNQNSISVKIQEALSLFSSGSITDHFFCMCEGKYDLIPKVLFTLNYFKSLT